MSLGSPLDIVALGGGLAVGLADMARGTVTGLLWVDAVISLVITDTRARVAVSTSRGISC